MATASSSFDPSSPCTSRKWPVQLGLESTIKIASYEPSEKAGRSPTWPDLSAAIVAAGLVDFAPRQLSVGLAGPPLQQCSSRETRSFSTLFVGAFSGHGAAGSAGEPLKNKGNFGEAMRQQKINLAGFDFF
jgi:hypothetical protein